MLYRIVIELMISVAAGVANNGFSWTGLWEEFKSWKTNEYSAALEDCNLNLGCVHK